MTAWTDFVKNNMSKVSDLPQRERLKKLSEMYKGGMKEEPMKKTVKPKMKKTKPEGRREAKGGMMSAGALKSPLEMLKEEMAGKPKKVRGGRLGAIVSAGGLSSGGALVSAGKYNIRDGHHEDNGGITSFYPDILM